MKKNLNYITLLLLTLCSGRAIAQMCAPAPDACGTHATISPTTLPNVVNFCPGDKYTIPTITVSGSPFTVHSYAWSPASVVTTTSGGSGAPMTFSGIATGSAFSISYTFSAVMYGPQLINNGDFHNQPPCSSGCPIYDCFNSQYQDYQGPNGSHHGHIKLGGFGGEYISGQTCMDPRGLTDYHYDVFTHSGPACGWSGCSNMLCVRGAEPGYGRQYQDFWHAWHRDKNAMIGPGYFWGQNVQLCKNAKYHMTYFVRMMDMCHSAAEQPTIGVAIPTSNTSCPVTTAENDHWTFTPNYLDAHPFPFPFPAMCDTQWYRRDFEFIYSGPSGSVFICMVDLNTSGSGNAFGIDDISLNRVETVSTSPFTISPPSPAPVVPTHPLCVGVSDALAITGGNGDIVTYTITKGSATLASGTGTIVGGSLTTAAITPTSCGSVQVNIISVQQFSCPHVFKFIPPLSFTEPVYAAATISGPKYICGIGNSITLKESGGCPGTSHSWSSSNLAVATVSPTGVVTAHASGVVTITYNNGSPCAVSQVVTVYAASEYVTADGGTGVGSSNWCQGDHKNFYINGDAGDLVTYHITDASGSLPAVTGTIPGTHILPVPYTCPVVGTVTLTITKVVGGSVCTFTTTIHGSMIVDVTPTPGIISIPNPLCGNWSPSGALAHFSGLPALGGLWTNSNPSLGSINPATGYLSTNDIPYPSSQTSVITYSFTNHCGHTSASTAVTLNATPTASVTYAGGGCVAPGIVTVCSGFKPTVTIHAPVGTQLSYYLNTHISGLIGPWIITMTAPTYNLILPAPTPTNMFVEIILSSISDPVTGCMRYLYYHPNTDIKFLPQSPDVHFVVPSSIGQCEGTALVLPLKGLAGSTLYVDNGHGLVTPITLDMAGNGAYHDVVHATPYTYCIKSITGPGGCCVIYPPDPLITNPCVTVYPWALPTVTLTNITPPPCSAVRFPVTLVAGGSPVATYTWSGPGLGTIITPGTVHTESVPSTTGGTYIVRGTEPVHGCFTTASLVVTSLPTSISGPTNVCLGGTITLTASTLHGTWSSSSPGIASVTSVGISGATANITGISVGGAIITYTTATDCWVLYNIGVTPIDPITGTAVVCAPGATTTLSHSGIGTWSSNNTHIATVSSSGVVTGIAVGTTIITFTETGGCYTTIKLEVMASGPVVPCSFGGVVVGGIAYWTISGTPGAVVTLTYLGTGCPTTPFTVTLDPVTGIGLVSGCGYGITLLSATYGGCTTTLTCSGTWRHADTASGTQVPAHMETSLSVVPNPNTGSFTISGTIAGEDGMHEARIEIIDMLGKTILSDWTTINNGEVSKNIALGSTVANGVYLARITTGSENHVIRFTVSR